MLLGLLFFILIAGLCLNLLTQRSLVSPGVLFNAVWLITLTLYQLKISYLITDLSQRTVTVMLACVVPYNAVILMLHLLSKRRRYIFPNTQPNFNIAKKESFPLRKRIKTILYIITFVFLLQIYYSGGVPLLWKITGNSKNYFDFGIPSLNGAFTGLVVCMGTYFIFKKKKTLAFLCVFIGILIVSRQVIISIFVQSFTVMFLSYRRIDGRKDRRKDGSVKRKMSIPQFALIIVVIIIGFSVLGNFRSGNNTMEDIFYAKEQYQNLPVPLRWIYSYTTFSVSNFNNLTSMTNGGVNMGATVLNGFLPTVLTNMFQIVPKYSPYFLVLGNFTVSTYLAHIYLDFGILGIFIFNAFIAALGWYFYSRVKNSRYSIKTSMIYSVYAHNILLLFFTNMFFLFPIIVQWAYIPFIWKQKTIVYFEQKLSTQE
jgi:oligosaccharide repeat unit polymerase